MPLPSPALLLPFVLGLAASGCGQAAREPPQDAAQEPAPLRSLHLRGVPPGLASRVVAESWGIPVVVFSGESSGIRVEVEPVDAPDDALKAISAASSLAWGREDFEEARGGPVQPWRWMAPEPQAQRLRDWEPRLTPRGTLALDLHQVQAGLLLNLLATEGGVRLEGTVQGAVGVWGLHLSPTRLIDLLAAAAGAHLEVDDVVVHVEGGDPLPVAPAAERCPDDEVGAVATCVAGDQLALVGISHGEREGVAVFTDGVHAPVSAIAGDRVGAPPETAEEGWTLTKVAPDRVHLRHPLTRAVRELPLAEAYPAPASPSAP